MANNIPSYQEQLESQEWRLLRETIIKRDGSKCSICGKGPSEIVRFDESAFFVGIDFSKENVDCSKADLSTIRKLTDYVKSWDKKNLKRGVVPQTDMIGFISEEGYYIYSPWKKEDDYKDVDMNEANIVQVVCGSGDIINVVFTDAKSLNNLKLPRVYIQKTPLNLHVHHKRYILNKMAWEYECDELVTLCSECHSKIHQHLPVLVYANVDGQMKMMNYTPCKRCNGAGYLSEYHYVENGICFRCRGARFEELIENNNLQEINP